MSRRRVLAAVPVVAIALAGCASSDPTVDLAIEAAETLRTGEHGEPVVEPRLGRGPEVIEFTPDGPWGAQIRCLDAEMTIAFAIDGEEVVEQQDCSEGMLGFHRRVPGGERVHLAVQTEAQGTWVLQVTQG
ncbi:hypothetical protein J4G33_05930 [Actinotalea sp. BY-33]|uniref:Uncharacterized protein n=1 Tax=Actinotalea soli TaxID=2819234 RepID=A0A939LPK9_9CELL|nr:hypothetical protein [Actinotalea soli]MBO1751338.1 hypothetical protein [Actinotalea soli]